MDRREFIKQTAAGALAASLAGLPVSAQNGPLPRRPLGKMGFEASIHGFGAMTIPDEGYEEIMVRVEHGCNYVDTAHCYQGGNGERKLGTILPRYREQFFVATKWGHDQSEDGLVAWLDESLQRMKIDYVDLIQLHMAKSPEMIHDERVHNAFARVKQVGKARFLGFTTHENMVETAHAGIDSGLYSSMLLKNGPLANQQFNLDPVIKKAHDAGMAVIAMKSQEGNRPFPGSDEFLAQGVNMHQARVKWVLQNPNVSVLLTDCTSVQVAEENSVAAKQVLTAAERQALRQYLRTAKSYVCTWCEVCSAQCPQQIAIADILRYRSYATGYGNPALGRELYAKLPKDRTVLACRRCGTCQGACPNGIAVMQELQEAHRVLA
jgi:hypothetical protein